MNNSSSAIDNNTIELDSFAPMGLSDHLLRTVKEAGYVVPTPIQVQAIPHVLAGKDLLGCAQTGTGKTAAFALPILQGIMERGRPHGRAVIQALVLAPTRELAAQIGVSFEKYAGARGPRQLVVFGGVSKRLQIQALRRSVDVLIATPGRLLDLMGDGAVKLGQVETFVLDEADRMLDMGFIHDVRRITKTIPKSRQTLMFSATMPKEIQDLADRTLKDPVHVSVDPVSSTREPIAQSVYFVEKSNKTSLLMKLLGTDEIDRALVFTRTKHGANRVTEKLVRAGFGAAAIHGNKSQSARVRALAEFKAGRIRIVVATDIAARGIDIKDLSHVINFDLPNEPENYVHRVGRTGRAGATGVAVSFCSGEEREYLRDIERLTRREIEQVAIPEGLPKVSKAKPVEGVAGEPRNLRPQRRSRRRRSGARNGNAGHGSGRNGGARNSSARNGNAGQGNARSGNARQGGARNANARTAAR